MLHQARAKKLSESTIILHEVIFKEPLIDNKWEVLSISIQTCHSSAHLGAAGGKTHTKKILELEKTCFKINSTPVKNVQTSVLILHSPQRLWKKISSREKTRFMKEH